MGKKALTIAGVNAAAIAASLILFVSPLGDKPGSIHPVLILPLLYAVLSIFVAFAGIICGILGLLRDSQKKPATIGLLLNLAYVTAVVSIFLMAWPAMLGI